MAVKIAAIVLLICIMAGAPAATADPSNNQSTQQLCRDADYADLHPMLCKGPFSLGPNGHGGHSGGLLSGIPIIGGLL